MLRLHLVRHAGTAVTRSPVVPGDEPALRALPDLTPWLGRTGTVLTSPARRCRVDGADVEPRLRPWDLGAWSGQPLDQLDQLDLTAWRSDPAYDAHGGESLLALCTRVSALLQVWKQTEGRLVAVTHAAVIKAAVTHALAAPPTSCWAVDVAPGSLTELHGTPGGWRVVRVNQHEP